MTAEKLHDALNLLPGDLITATDRLRTTPKPMVIHWKRWASLAACLILVLGAAMVFQRKILPGMGGMTESAAQAPAAMVSAAMDSKMEDAAAPESPAEEAMPETGIVNGSTTEEKAAEDELSIDHSHRFAEETEENSNSIGYCGNMLTTIHVEGEEYTVSGTDSVTLTDILRNLPYDPEEVCRCRAEFTVDTEMLTGIEVNLTQGFARCEKGQAALTEKQAERIRSILEDLA